VVATPAQLLEDPAVELVVVAAPNSVHYEMAGAALRAGRHVVVDKPFVIRLAEADELIELAEREGRVLSAFHNRRWDNDFLTVERCVRAGLLGRVSTYVARYDRFRPQPSRGWLEEDLPGSGVLYDLGTHLIDQALHLFGLPTTVMADLQMQRPGAIVADYLHVVLGYEKLRVVLQAGSLVRARGPRFEVHGDKGSFVKHGIDGQEAALRSGTRPGDPGWGADRPDRYGTLTTEVGGLEVTGSVTTVPGAYESFYREMARAIRGREARDHVALDRHRRRRDPHRLIADQRGSLISPAWRRPTPRTTRLPPPRSRRSPAAAPRGCRAGLPSAGAPLPRGNGRCRGRGAGPSSPG